MKPSLFIRIGALLLVPSLAAEPAFANFRLNPILLESKIGNRKSEISLFTSQALAAGLVSGVNALCWRAKMRWARWVAGSDGELNIADIGLRARGRDHKWINKGIEADFEEGTLKTEVSCAVFRSGEMKSIIG